MSHLIWVPLAIISSSMSAWLSTKVGNGGKLFFFGPWAWGCIPLWTVVAKYSKNIFYDALLYDVIMLVSYTLAMLYFTQTELKPINMFGLFLLFVAAMLIKI